MSVGHYENFPVASRLVPARLRPAVVAIYRFARAADDLADEVRSLSEQSRQAAAQVKVILGDIQKATNLAVMATEQGTKAVEAGVQQSAQAGESIQSLTNSVTESAQAATQIAASSQQQLIGVDQVAVAMEHIKRATAQNVVSAIVPVSRT